MRAISVGLLVIGLARADSDEAWLLRASLPPGMQPLLALIVDGSGATFSAGEPFDPARDYAAGLATDRCDPARIYWRRGPGPAPDCAAQAGLEPAASGALAGLRCEAALGPLAQQGFFIASRAAQWRGAAEDGYWSALSPDSQRAVECRSDRGRHGATAGIWYAANGAAGPWATGESAEIDWDLAPHADPYIFYGGNYLNFLRSTRTPTETPIADAINRSLAAALSATDELEIALIRVDGETGEGGYVAHAPMPSASAAAALPASAGAAPGRSAPLAEALSESAAWLGGHAVRFGDHRNADRAAFDSLAPGRYRSPFAHACRPVTLAYLTAGLASGDDLAATAAVTLPRFTELTAGCGASCLPAIAQWVERADLRDDLPGVQSTALHWLTPRPVPELVAQSAGTGSGGALDDPLAFINLVARSLQRDAAVPGSPQFSAAGMAPLADPDDGPGLVYGLTAPVARQRWVGNLFRYGLRAAGSPLASPIIVDRDDEPAIESATGLPKPSSRSYWSDAPDANLLAGGAAGRLPVADVRRIYSDLASSRMHDPANRLSPDNVRLDRRMFGLGAGDPESPAEIVAQLAEQRMLGDPGPHAPIVVDYPASDRQLVFAVTQDGMLQAFDAHSGVEAWAWLPKEMLPRLVGLLRNESTTVRSHGIDGPMVLHRHDPDGDGRIDRDAGEHLWLLFGLGRGGNRYHAVDVSSADDPRLLWSMALPGGGEVDADAEPVVTRLAVADSGQSAGDWVVLLAGGYDRRFDAAGVAARGHGNALHVVDALTGRLLWTASGNDADAPDLAVGGLASSAPSAPRALDLDGDGYLDRAYLLDVTGGLWRFDFRSGNPANEVASARLLARLGDGQRRFHATPDASLVRISGAMQLAIAFGSGWQSRPRDTTIIDRFYVLLDTETPAGPSVLTEADLHEVSDEPADNAPSAPGWFLRLDGHGAGEKVIGPAVTFDHVLRFQTYQPLDDDAAAPCGPPRSVRRLYALDIRDGRPHASAVESAEDEAQELAGSGLPVGLRFGFPGRRDAHCDECPARAFGVIGAETFDAGYAGDPVRTSWRKLRAPPDSP
ncbi:MAG: pilus assembly protein [Steroidobacteraceae bacterium]